MSGTHHICDSVSCNAARVKAAALAMTIVLAMSLELGQQAHAQTFQVLYNFTDGDDGINPRTGVVIDHAGNLYGTSFIGGDGDGGVVFKMTHRGSSWTFTTLHRFVRSEGIAPMGITIGPDGNLYGANNFGGVGCSGGGCGTVFEVSPPASCTDLNCPWTATVLHMFGGGSDGSYPMAGVVFDQAGNLYGTTSSGSYYGVAYEVSHAGGTWTYDVIHTFLGGPSDGGYPVGSLILDNAGNLYGTTTGGGPLGLGTVFQISPSQSGWNESVLWSFPNRWGLDGWQPYGAVIFDSAGNLYGTTNRGGAGDGAENCGEAQCGTAFEISPMSGGWTETVLHDFDLLNGDASPYAGLTADAAGNLYGTTGGLNGLNRHSDGNVFKLTRSNGGWIYTSLHEFQHFDGEDPVGAVAIDANGNLYGTTTYGGTYGYGEVWEITP